MKDSVTVLIETKQNFTKADEEQLSAYVEYEKALTGNKTVAILANTMNDTVRVWRGVVSDSDLMTKKGEIKIPLHSKTIQECSDISVVLNRLQCL